tara:strand:+ start:1586 stop:1876 length:291 start_codon:yes stop_codon:yes gene_type:complete
MDNNSKLISEAYSEIVENTRNQLFDLFKTSIKDMDPAVDVRELYKDIVELNVPREFLDKILEDAVEADLLHPKEAYFIRTGENEPTHHQDEMNFDF